MVANRRESQPTKGQARGGCVHPTVQQNKPPTPPTQPPKQIKRLCNASPPFIPYIKLNDESTLSFVAGPKPRLHLENVRAQ